MDNLAQSYQPNSVETAGLDDLFQEPGSCPVLCPDLSPDRTMPTPAQWWTLPEASDALKCNERTLRRWIKQGKIQAAKVKGAFGDEWRIMPGPVRSGVDITPGQNSECPDLTDPGWTSPPDIECPPSLDTPNTLPGPDPESLELRIKLQLAEQENATLKNQLQGATYRNGYLEALLEAERNQVKLLTDSQHKTTWWHRFCSWFAGQ